MKFVNDPKACDIPKVGSGRSALLARRTECGEAVSWVPGGDAQALVAFVGSDTLVALNGEVYSRQADRSLVPFDTSVPFVIVRPPAGEMRFVAPAHVEQQWARVDVTFEPGVGDRSAEDAASSVLVEVAGDRAGPSVADAVTPVKRSPGRPKKAV